MTSLLFQEWLLKFDADMAKQNRQVLLLLANASTHAVLTLNLKNVTVLFLPPNTNSHIQPMDAGIIAAFKKRYRSFQLGFALDREADGHQDIYKVHILQAMYWCRDAWKMITPLVINCWFHTGLLDGNIPENDTNDVQENDNAIVEQTLNEQLSKQSVKPMSIEEYILKDTEFEVHQEFDEDQILVTFLSDDDEGEGPMNNLRSP